MSVDDRVRKRSLRPRLTIWHLMSIVAIAAIDFVLAKGIMSDMRLVSWKIIIVIVLAYDVLVYFTYLATIKLVRPNPDDRKFTWWTAIVAVAVIAVCAGGPLLYAVIAILEL